MTAPMLVSVEWLDAWVDGSDQVSVGDPDPHHHALLMQTIGWLVREDESGVSIFNERCLDEGDGSYRSRTFIPRGMIQSVTPFCMSKPRAKRTPKVPATPT